MLNWRKTWGGQPQESIYIGGIGTSQSSSKFWQHMLHTDPLTQLLCQTKETIQLSAFDSGAKQPDIGSHINQSNFLTCQKTWKMDLPETDQNIKRAFQHIAALSLCTLAHILRWKH